jgi:hypothetical protein
LHGVVAWLLLRPGSTAGSLNTATGVACVKIDSGCSQLNCIAGGLICPPPADEEHRSDQNTSCHEQMRDSVCSR